MLYEALQHSYLCFSLCALLDYSCKRNFIGKVFIRFYYFKQSFILNFIVQGEKMKTTKNEKNKSDVANEKRKTELNRRSENEKKNKNKSSGG